MQKPTVLLVNPNRMRPPIGPVGLEYVAADLHRRSYQILPCDLTFTDDWPSELDAAIDDTQPAAVAITVRNIDDAYFASRDFVLETTAQMVRHIATRTDAPTILGGVGFSMAPREILRYTGADYGIVSDGETALSELLDCIAADGNPRHVAGAVFRLGDDRIGVSPPKMRDIRSIETPRDRFDNPRYFSEGGQAGIETKRGCNRACVYCPEPAAKGRRIRLRNPEHVVREFEALLEQGIDTFHLCDSEFNLPPEHARAVCQAIIDRGLASRIKWYTYACPQPFKPDLARIMKRAGCAGIDFGVDHSEPAILLRLGRSFTPAEIKRTAQACRDAGLALMFDLLLGGPGETCETLRAAIDFMREIGPDRIGLSCGIRLYPHTRLTREIQAQGPPQENPDLCGAVYDNPDFLRPVFYMDAAVRDRINEVIDDMVRGDKRFLHADPDQVDGNYNYNDNSVLAKAIQSGERGAYWDILRRIAPSSR